MAFFFLLTTLIYGNVPKSKLKPAGAPNDPKSKVPPPPDAELAVAKAALA